MLCIYNDSTELLFEIDVITRMDKYTAIYYI
jgi:hypothetical protein